MPWEQVSGVSLHLFIRVTHSHELFNRVNFGNRVLFVPFLLCFDSRSDIEQGLSHQNCKLTLPDTETSTKSRHTSLPEPELCKFFKRTLGPKAAQGLRQEKVTLVELGLGC